LAETQGQAVVAAVETVAAEEHEKDLVGEANHHKMAMLDQVMKVQAEGP
jgi:hypothetical protein